MNYPDYDPRSAVTPLSETELDAVERALASLAGDAVMTLDGLDGYLTALSLGPTDWLAAVPTHLWLPLIWGGDGPDDGPAPFASNRQRKNLVVQVLRHRRSLDAQFESGAQTWEPIFSVAEDDSREWVDACDWCAGFLQAVDLNPAAWAAVWDDPALGPRLAALLQLGGGLGDEAPTEDAEEALGEPEVVDALSRSVPEAVLAVWAHWHATPNA